MQKLKAWLNEERGRQVALARHLRIATPNVVAWVRGEKPVPAVHAPAIEQFTDGAVTRRDLRPHDWARIWPELAVNEKQGA